jgi:hypothetical protein
MAWTRCHQLSSQYLVMVPLEDMANHSAAANSSFFTAANRWEQWGLQGSESSSSGGFRGWGVPGFEFGASAGEEGRCVGVRDVAVTLRC